MSRAILLALVCAFLSPAQMFRDAGDPDNRDAMSVEELHREPVTFELDIPYAGTRNRSQRLDLYLPRDRAAGKLPVIVFVHGGGWFRGDKADGAGRLIPLVRTGRYAGVSVGYRLSGEAPWPAQIHDCKAAIRWVRGNAEKYGFDPDRIGVFGRSAGGHLVLMLGLAGDTPGLEGDLGPYKGVSTKVAAVANFFGITELFVLPPWPSDVDRRTEGFQASLIGGPVSENLAIAKAASPITYVTPDDPPVLTVHGSVDRSVPYGQAVRLDAALRKAGVPSYFVTVKGAGHGNFGTAANNRVQAFFDRYLRGEPVEISTTPIEWRKR